MCCSRVFPARSCDSCGPAHSSACSQFALSTTSRVGCVLIRSVFRLLVYDFCWWFQAAYSALRFPAPVTWFVWVAGGLRCDHALAGAQKVLGFGTVQSMRGQQPFGPCPEELEGCALDCVSDTSGRWHISCRAICCILIVQSAQTVGCIVGGHTAVE